jgi:hypothetical protein
MEENKLRLSFEGADKALAGMCAQELRKQLLEDLPPGVNVTLQRDRPDSMDLGTAMLIDIAGAGLIHLVFKAIEHFQRPHGVALRVDMGGRVAVIEDVSPDSVMRQLRNLQQGAPDQQ